MKRKRTHTDDGEGDETRQQPRALKAARPARLLTPSPATAPCSPQIVAHSSISAPPTPSSSSGTPTSLKNDRDTASESAPAAPTNATLQDGYLSIHNSQLPTPYCHVYLDTYDHEFGAKVCARYMASGIRDAWRRARYGAEVADRWKRGSTPEEAREEAKAKDLAMEKIAFDWSSDDEDDDAADQAWESARVAQRRTSPITRERGAHVDTGGGMTVGRRNSGGTSKATVQAALNFRVWYAADKLRATA